MVQHLREYIHQTDALRKDHSQLLLSYVKAFRPVARDTVSRWVKQVLQYAGIDVTKYSAHSCRAASTSNVKVKDLNITEIMKRAGWSTARLSQSRSHGFLVWCGVSGLVWSRSALVRSRFALSQATRSKARLVSKSSQLRVPLRGSMITQCPTLQLTLALYC